MYGMSSVRPTPPPPKKSVSQRSVNPNLSKRKFSHTLVLGMYVLQCAFLGWVMNPGSSDVPNFTDCKVLLNYATTYVQNLSASLSTIYIYIQVLKKVCTTHCMQEYTPLLKWQVVCDPKPEIIRKSWPRKCSLCEYIFPSAFHSRAFIPLFLWKKGGGLLCTNLLLSHSTGVLWDWGLTLDFASCWEDQFLFIFIFFDTGHQSLCQNTLIFICLD